MQLEGTCNLQSSVHTITHERPHKFHALFRLSSVSIPSNKGLLLVKGSEFDLPIIQTASLDELASPRTKRNQGQGSITRIANSSSSLFGELNKRKMSEGSGDSLAATPRRGSMESGRRDSLHDWSRSSEIQKGSSEHTYNSHFKKRYSSFKRRWGQAFQVIQDFPENIMEYDASLYNKDALEYYESL